MIFFGPRAKLGFCYFNFNQCYGELSVSLWDLHDLAGLPMMGYLYDEVAPSALELANVDEKRDRFIPRSSKYLFYAYYLLQSTDDSQCSSVSIDKWVKFWSKKAIKYYLSPFRKEKKIIRPKSTHNSLGDIATHERWLTAEEALFNKLCIKGNLKEEAYLTTYLACWFCTFVLLGKDINFIRPSTFKMASMILWRQVRKSPSHNLADSDSSNKDRHWKRQKKELTPLKATKPVHHDPLWQISLQRSYLIDQLEDEVQPIDVSEESQTSQKMIMGSNLLTTTPPLGMGPKRKQLPRPTAVSVFEG
ncbi:UNVERIFIED_CONTAM: hypothetical protein Sradi_3250400 [Sesamum radiatum]|uniref:Aminotransferase-like plant mobile domain-containing protein n=1 Tax=Sesamum radiatum TaxID=300843 RepID=A0AAW2QZL8_SESRA